jgi:hypothetical protein
MTQRFLYEPGDEIRLLDLAARCAFKSEGSISFDLGFNDEGFCVIGFVDLHYPCEGHIKVHLRVGVPPQHYREASDRLAFVRQLFGALAIPADETYEATFVDATESNAVVQPVDRAGMTDRFLCG